jgi:hypothetical protein
VKFYHKQSEDVIGIGRLDVLGFDIPEDKPITLIMNGKLTRAGALVEARKLHGDMAMISSPDLPVCMVWEIGYFSQTVGRGKTWEQALGRARIRAKEEKK